LKNYAGGVSRIFKPASDDGLKILNIDLAEIFNLQSSNLQVKNV